MGECEEYAKCFGQTFEWKTREKLFVLIIMVVLKCTTI